MKARTKAKPDPLQVDAAAEYLEDAETYLSRAAHALQDAHPDHYPQDAAGRIKALNDAAAAVLRMAVSAARCMYGLPPT